MTALALDVEIAAPGVFEGLPDAVYHSDPVKGGSLSSTGARALLPPGCPAKFRYDQLHPRPGKREFDLGHAAHQMVLGTGPEIVVIEADDWRTKAAKATRDEAYRAGAVPLLPFEYDQVEDMAAAIVADPVASAVLRPGRGRAELTLVWADAITGVMRRARLDYLTSSTDGRTLVVDYKTAASAEPSAIERSMQQWGYHQQLDYYIDGVEELGLSPSRSLTVGLLVVQEKNPPYVVTVVQLAQSALDIGAGLNRASIDRYAHCLKTGVWPGYTTEITVAALPVWAERSATEALETGAYDLPGSKN